MPEKNIVVNRGIPMTPSISGPGAGRYNSFSPGAGAGHYGDDHHAGDDSFAYYAEQENRASQIQAAYAQRLLTLPQVIETELAAVRALGDNSAVAPVAALTRELGVRDALIAGKTAEAAEQQKIANTFYGVDPTTKTLDDWASLYNSGKDPVALLADWTASYTAAYTAKFINEELKLLATQSAGVRESLVAAQTVEAEQARLAAEAAAKAAADKAAADAAVKAAADKAAADAAAKAAADKAAAEQARLAAEAIRIANTFRASGSASTAGPVFMTSAGTVAVIEAAAVTLQAAIRAAITALGGLVASVGAGLVVGVSALFYSSKLANGELPERYAFSTPLTDLAPDHGQDLNAIAAAGGSIDVPYRVSSKTAEDGQSEVFVVKTDGVTVPSKVRVVAATYDAAQKVYTATTADVPPRTLTWTPIVNPGNSSTTSPAEQPTPPVYTGATVTPVEGRIDTFPAVSEASFDDFITVFPADSGLPPIYTMFRDRREDAGVATGVGQSVSGNWLGAASQGEGAPIPSQIADQLRGKEFKNFRAFREAFWKAVSNDPQLSKQFISNNISEMKNGRAPFVRKGDRVGGQVKFELHHTTYVSKGGAVFDIDNIRVVTPKQHGSIHAEGK